MYNYARKLAHTQGYFCMHEVHTCAMVDIFVQASLGSKIPIDEGLSGSSWRYLALNPLADSVDSFGKFDCFSSSYDFFTQSFGRWRAADILKKDSCSRFLSILCSGFCTLRCSIFGDCLTLIDHCAHPGFAWRRIAQIFFSRYCHTDCLEPFRSSASHDCLNESIPCTDTQSNHMFSVIFIHAFCTRSFTNEHRYARIRAV